MPRVYIPTKLPVTRSGRVRLLNRLIDQRSTVARAAVTPAGDRLWQRLNQTINRLHGIKD